MDWSEAAAANLEIFGEPATYRKADGSTRPISVLVYRMPPEPSLQQKGVLETKTRIFVLNNAALGISATELQTQSDQVDFPERVGGTARAWQISRIVNQDPTGLVLEVD
ncbi:MAG TPA: hypothetical protein PLG73_10785 [Candidatus Sumerlaeota bacterium]|nr:hypothetical protein [Candidatus Sumerlaeota bacterium]